MKKIVITTVILAMSAFAHAGTTQPRTVSATVASAKPLDASAPQKVARTIETCSVTETTGAVTCSKTEVPYSGKQTVQYKLKFKVMDGEKQVVSGSIDASDGVPAMFFSGKETPYVSGIILHKDGSTEKKIDVLRTGFFLNLIWPSQQTNGSVSTIVNASMTELRAIEMIEPGLQLPKTSAAMIAQAANLDGKTPVTIKFKVLCQEQTDCKPVPDMTLVLEAEKI